MKFQSLGEGQPTVIVSLESGYLYTGNQTTQAFLQAIDGRKTFGAILDEVTGQFVVTREKLRTDLSALAEKMMAEKLLSDVTHA
jgi:pyrroloquinoline quinone biosynthesis protein D